jgi:hypothetical protein
MLKTEMLKSWGLGKRVCGCVGVWVGVWVCDVGVWVCGCGCVGMWVNCPFSAFSSFPLACGAAGRRRPRFALTRWPAARRDAVALTLRAFPHPHSHTHTLTHSHFLPKNSLTLNAYFNTHVLKNFLWCRDLSADAVRSVLKPVTLEDHMITDGLTPKQLGLLVGKGKGGEA